MDKKQLQEAIINAWHSYLTYADPAVRARFASQYCQLKEQYVSLYGEEE